MPLTAEAIKILLVEDDPKVVSVINRGLNDAGYQVSVAPDGPTGLQMATYYHYDLIILDIMLPGINGLELCKALRKENLKVPVLMLTALGTTENIVTGLDSGADDYMVKPFRFEELGARIRTLLRRAGTFVADERHVIKIADVELNTDTKTVTRAGAAVKVTATEFRLLEFLMKNRGKVLSRIDILEHVWNIDFNMGTNVVEVYVNYLRKKLEKNGASRLIHTVIGMGYVLKEELVDENTD